MHKQFFFQIALCLLILFLLSAQTNPLLQKDNSPLGNQGEQKIQKRCQKFSSLLGNVDTRYQKHQKNHLAVYNQVKTMVKNLAQNMKHNGYDTSKLEKDLSEMEKLINKFSNRSQIMINQFQKTKQMACGVASDEKANGYLLQSIQEIRHTQQNHLNIRNHYQNVIRIDIQNMLLQTPATK